MRAGSLKHYVTIEQPQSSQADDGTPVVTWVEFAKRHAARNDAAGAERDGRVGEVATRVTRLRMSYLAGVTADMRVILDGEAWNITGIAQIGFRKGTDLFLQISTRGA